MKHQADLRQYCEQSWLGNPRGCGLSGYLSCGKKNYIKYFSQSVRKILDLWRYDCIRWRYDCDWRYDCIRWRHNSDSDVMIVFVDVIRAPKRKLKKSLISETKHISGLIDKTLFLKVLQTFFYKGGGWDILFVLIFHDISLSTFKNPAGISLIQLSQQLLSKLIFKQLFFL